MTKKTKHCVFVLDQTGSMYDKKKDTIGGFNDFLEKQKKIKKHSIKFSLILFNSLKVEKRHIAVDVNKVKLLTDKTYVPNGMTPLWDAVGMAISENDKKKDVFFVILTDGLENASQELNSEKVKKMIKKKEKRGWGFIYLGVDLTNFADAGMMGIAQASTFHVDSRNIKHLLGNNLVATASSYYDTGSVDHKEEKTP